MFHIKRLSKVPVAKVRNNFPDLNSIAMSLDTPLDPWNTLKERGYRVKHTLGKGTFSTVREGYSSRLGRTVAIKCVNCKATSKKFREKLLPWQVEKLPLLRHENITRVFEILEAKGDLVFIVMEEAHNFDMLRVIQQKGHLNEAEIRRYFVQLCKALEYLHSRSLYHGNLKCENLLLDKNNKLLVSDCGFIHAEYPRRREAPSAPSSSYIGKLEYASPEVLQGFHYDPRLQDLWSVGVITYMMACGRIPFNPCNVKLMIRAQLRNNVKYPRKMEKMLSLSLKHFIRYQLQAQPSKRPSLRSVLSHPFIERFCASALAQVFS